MSRYRRPRYVRKEITLTNRLAFRVSAKTGRKQMQQNTPRGTLPCTYSMTSSARASSIAGTSRPSALAVFRLITSSYLVGCCTGRTAGLL